jgi:hypothetical protein
MELMKVRFVLCLDDPEEDGFDEFLISKLSEMETLC